MSLIRVRKASLALSVLVGLLTLFYSWFGLVGLTFFGQRLRGFKESALFLAPLLAFPIFLLGLYSLKLSTILLWTYVLGAFLSGVLLSWPNFDLTVAERALLLAAVLQHGAYTVAKRDSEVEEGGG